MRLSNPFIITSRLLPGLKVGDGYISLKHVSYDNGRAVFGWYIDIPAGEFSAADLKSGVGGCNYQEMFSVLLSFLGACAESYACYLRTSDIGDNQELFPPEVSEWAYQYDDELSMLKEEIDTTPNLIEE